jgi:hypothetical protein
MNPMAPAISQLIFVCCLCFLRQKRKKDDGARDHQNDSDNQRRNAVFANGYILKLRQFPSPPQISVQKPFPNRAAFRLRKAYRKSGCHWHHSTELFGQ